MRLILLLGCCIFLSLLLSGCIVTTRNAYQVGYVTAVETNGMIFLEDRVYIKSDIESSQEESWCVEDESVKAALESARDNNSRIKVKYHDEMFYWPDRCHNVEGMGIIDAVEVLG